MSPTLCDRARQQYQRQVFHRILEWTMQATLEQRRALFAPLSGDVLELGIGTGTNLPLYVGKVRSLRAVEHVPALAAASRERARSLGLALDVIEHDATAPGLVPESSADAVVITFVLCSVVDAAALLQNARRYLRPGGSLYLLEHTARPDWTRGAQRLLRRPWKRALGGCDLCLQLAPALAAGGFSTEGLRWGRLPMPWPVSYGAWGRVSPLAQPRAGW